MKNRLRSRRIAEDVAQTHSETIAAPGAGKTYSLVQKLMSWITEDGVSPEQILVLSFSNATVDELKERIARAAKSEDSSTTQSPSDLDKVCVKTAHGFANGLLKRQIIVNDQRAHRLLHQAITSVQRRCQRRRLWPDMSAEQRQRREQQLCDLAEARNIPFVIRFFDVLRATRRRIIELADSGQFSGFRPYIQVLKVVRKRYQELKQQEGTRDYGDMLRLATLAIVSGFAKIPYSHILVDEYQDCSAAQGHMLAALANRDHRCLTVFGDPNQAIYSFGGSSYTPLSTLVDNVKVFRLPFSRRLTVENAAFASALAGFDDAQQIQSRRHGISPKLICAGSQTEQVAHVCTDIHNLIQSGVNPERISVLARTNALLQPVEQALLDQSFDVNFLGKIRDRKHVFQVLRLVHMVYRGKKNGETITAQVLQNRFPRIKEPDPSKWKRAASDLKRAALIPSLEGRYQSCAKTYLRLLGGVRKNKDIASDINRWEPICRSYVSVAAMKQRIKEITNASIALSTIHGAKGKEWDYVFVVGVTDGYMPLYHALDDEFALNEERNLLYVAVTRAREAVRLYHSPTNHARSRQRFDQVSRFLNTVDVRKHLVEECC